MIRDYVIVHYHEIGLKGRNRAFFEQALVKNIRRATGCDVKRLPGRLLVSLDADTDTGVALERLRDVFGVANFAHASGAKLNLEEMCALAWEKMQDAECETFAVRARKAHSDFSLSAREINEKVGAFLLERSGKRVNLSNPDVTCAIEIVGDLVLVSVSKEAGAGGLPVGVSGRVAMLLSGGIDSPVAAARMMRRGSRVTLIHFHSQPYTDRSSERHAEELAQILARFQLDIGLWLAPLAPAQQVIASNCPEELRTILYRRMMMRIAGEIASKDGARVLVTGDSLGQVASQTIENLAAVEDASPLPVFRPLIGWDKIEIIAESQRLGMFEVSSAPCQEACVLFEPKRPATKASVAACRKAECSLDIPALVAAAAEGSELKSFRLD
ncbi:MAG: tRNA uracil 4-sulfurtransferase ThiI [Actinomycetota bacterium]|nr:tRNA 4-thiouridine(8) synthase ThiI [Actinomycetota bacterium]